jgi:hypothetical protein
MRNIALLAIFMILLGVGGRAVAAEPIARISVLSNGTLLLDGKPTTLVAVDRAFAALRASRGVVWYYREGAESTETPVVARQVLDLALNQTLPIRVSTKPDFSNEVGFDGRPIPREP